MNVFTSGLHEWLEVSDHLDAFHPVSEYLQVDGLHQEESFCDPFIFYRALGIATELPGSHQWGKFFHLCRWTFGFWSCFVCCHSGQAFCACTKLGHSTGRMVVHNLGRMVDSFYFLSKVEW